MAETKRPRGRPQVLADDVKVLTVRVSESTYTALVKLAGERTAASGATVRVSDLVRAAISDLPLEN